MFDTIVCSTRIEKPLPSALFQGGSFTFSGNRRFARFWLNPKEEYAPRVTYWRQPSVSDELPIEAGAHDEDVSDGTLRIEFSIRLFPLEGVDAWLGERFHDLPKVATWTTTRIDYHHDWDVGDNMDIYLDVFKRLRLASAQANVYDSGVMWKTATRAVKFYNKSKEMGFGRGWLRFEVSNQRQAIQYMCEHWFKCDHTVGQLVRADRASYVLNYYWNKLGLSSVEQYTSENDEFLRVTNAFGNRAARAWHVLRLIRDYGTDSIKRGLVSTTTFHRYRNELVAKGFITSSESNHPSIPALHLPESVS